MRTIQRDDDNPRPSIDPGRTAAFQLDIAAGKSIARFSDTLTARLANCSHAWCIVDHTNPHDSGDIHYSESAWAGPFQYALDILEGGTPAVSIGTGADPEYLDADELDALIAALIVKRGELADLAANTGAR